MDAVSQSQFRECLDKVCSKNKIFLKRFMIPNQLIFSLFISTFLFVMAFSNSLEEKKSSLQSLRISNGLLTRQDFIS